MKVLVFGAGFSVEAGYPPAERLMAEIGARCSNFPVNDQAERWQEFETWREKQKRGALGQICRSENPEYLLTYLDIADMIPDARLNEIFGQARGVELDRKTLAQMKRHIRSAYRGKERTIKRTLHKALADYFRWRNNEDSEPGALWRNGPYKRFFEQYVANGDTVLTFNYDTLAEHSLLELGKWTPADGYGFPVPASNVRSAVGATCPDRSLVKTLKLHGSVGWYEKGGRIKCKPWVLSEMGMLGDKLGERPSGDPTDLLLAPSFVKLIQNRQMASVWSAAARALRTAEQVIVIGYSLPKADAAARALLASSLGRRRCPITVIDPAHKLAVAVSYETVLGRPITHHRQEFSKWVESGYPT